MKKFTRSNLESIILNTNKLMKQAGSPVRYKVGVKAILTHANGDDAQVQETYMVNKGSIQELVCFAWGLEAAARNLLTPKSVEPAKEATASRGKYILSLAAGINSMIDLYFDEDTNVVTEVKVIDGERPVSIEIDVKDFEPENYGSKGDEFLEKIEDIRRKEYQVIWRINLSAKNPQEAAKEAAKMQSDADTTATVYEVMRGDEVVAVDVDKPAGKEIVDTKDFASFNILLEEATPHED